MHLKVGLQYLILAVKSILMCPNFDEPQVEDTYYVIRELAHYAIDDKSGLTAYALAMA